MGRLSFLLIMKDLLVVFRNPWDPKGFTLFGFQTRPCVVYPICFERDWWSGFLRCPATLITEVDSTGPLQKYSHEFRESDKEQKMPWIGKISGKRSGLFFLFGGGICRTKTSKDTSDWWSFGFLNQKESFSTRFWSWSAYGYFLGALNCWRKSDSGSPQRRKKRHMDYDCPFFWVMHGYSKWCNGGLEKASTLEHWEECGFTFATRKNPTADAIVSSWCVHLSF